MSSEGKAWVCATLGVALWITALLARARHGCDEPPAAAITGGWESVQLDHEPSQMRHQPTILQADAAVSPLGGERPSSPFHGQPVYPARPTAWETDAADDPPMPTCTPPAGNAFLLLPPAHQPQP